MDVIKEKKPDHLAVAFDNGGSQLVKRKFSQNTKHIK
jgi:hypothetical protein